MTNLAVLLITLAMFSTLPTALSAQTRPQESVPQRAHEIFTVAEQPPTFPGGRKALRDYIRQHVTYPEAARKVGLKGRVLVSFIINEDGTTQDIQVVKGMGYGCDEQAVRLVAEMTGWLPGRQAGQAIRFKYNLTIPFGPA